MALPPVDPNPVPPALAPPQPQQPIVVFGYDMTHCYQALCAFGESLKALATAVMQAVIATVRQLANRGPRRPRARARRRLAHGGTPAGRGGHPGQRAGAANPAGRPPTATGRSVLRRRRMSIEGDGELPISRRLFVDDDEGDGVAAGSTLKAIEHIRGSLIGSSGDAAPPGSAPTTWWPVTASAIAAAAAAADDREDAGGHKD